MEWVKESQKSESRSSIANFGFSFLGIMSREIVSLTY